MHPRTSQSGFSLVELSIVLVILGLLTGGILGGQALIRAAELRAVPTEYSRHITAVQTFRDKYFSIPGDMNNAVKFWGAQAGATTDGADATCTALDVSSPATGTPTCNGNGNGRVFGYSPTTTAAAAEIYRFWQHLANAGLIEGSFTGVLGTTIGGSTPLATTIGTNVPRSRISTAGWTFATWGNTPDPVGSAVRVLDYGHALIYGRTATHGFTSGTVLKPEEMWNIDSKIDDGRPGAGKLVTLGTDQSSCSTTNTPQADYRLDVSSVACGMVFINGL